MSDNYFIIQFIRFQLRATAHLNLTSFLSCVMGVLTLNVRVSFVQTRWPHPGYSKNCKGSSLQLIMDLLTVVMREIGLLNCSNCKQQTKIYELPEIKDKGRALIVQVINHVLLLPSDCTQRQIWQKLWPILKLGKPIQD